MNMSLPHNSDSILKAITNQPELPIIIFGASTVGEVLFDFLTKQGIHVTAFTENQIHKSNKQFCGIEVIHTSDLNDRFDDANFIISAADIGDVIHQLGLLGYNNHFAGGLLIENLDLEETTYSLPHDFIEFAASACITCHHSYLSPEKIILRSVDIMVTEKCSLKCTDCSNLMQYFEAPQNYTLESMMSSVESLCASVDTIHEFRVIGGEPFMNKNVYEVIQRLSEISNVQRVVIYTNGTIPLRKDKLDILQHNKVVLMITSYGELSKNLYRIETVCDDNGIVYHTRPAQGWTDCAKITKQNRTAEEHEETYKSCCAKGLYTVSNGELHRCPFSANAAQLGAIPDFKNDYVNLLTIDAETAKQELQNYFTDTTPLDACDYCTGRRLDDPQITPGIQTKVILDYTKQR